MFEKAIYIILLKFKRKLSYLNCIFAPDSGFVVKAILIKKNIMDSIL